MRGFGQQHGDNVLGGVIAEQLAQGFFVIRNAVTRDHIDEIPLRVYFWQDDGG